MRKMRLYLSTSLCLLFVLGAHSAALAQSGRRAPKPLSPPVSTQPPKEAEKPAAPSKPARRHHTLIAGMDGASLAIPLYMTEAVWNGFVDRLGKFSEVVVAAADKNMNRKEASERAKKQAENFVVLLQLNVPNVNAGVGQIGLEDLIVSYSIFSPGTGKVKESGQVHVRSSVSVLSRRLPTGRAGEAQLKDAGREAADRVLALLHIGSTAMNP